MKKFSECVIVLENNSKFVLLQVNPELANGLANHSWFNGNEDLIKYTKGANHAITIINKDKSRYSWEWGTNGFTIISDNLVKKQKVIVDYIEQELDIYCGEKPRLILKSIEDFYSNKKNRTKKSLINEKYEKGFFDLYNSETGQALKKMNNDKDIIKDIPRLSFGYYDTNYNNRTHKAKCLDVNCLFEILAVFEFGQVEFRMNNLPFHYLDYISNDLKSLDTFNNEQVILQTLDQLKELLLTLGYKDFTEYAQ